MADIKYFEKNLPSVVAEQSLRMVIVLLRQLESEKQVERRADADD